ncbi:MAG: sugar kinase [Microcella sp.]|uniref:sugar kinase n=1 Tax=Microcella sp. TaxID=1913979 RepID=UPI003315872B
MSVSASVEGAAGLLTFGESMGLVSSEGFGHFAHAPRARIGFGGAESNVAIGMRRLGIPATWASRLGDDPFGELIRRELRAEAVETLITTDTNRPTGIMVKERTSTSRTRVMYYRSGSAASALTEADLPQDRLSEFEVLHLTGITAALGNEPRNAVLVAAREARSLGVRVSFDLNYRAGLWGPLAAADFYRTMLPLVDVVFAGEDEAGLLFPNVMEPGELATRLMDCGAAEAVVKRGERGAWAKSGDDEEHAPARPARVVDSVGAGDSFVAGYLAELLRGTDLSGRLRVATTAGSLTCETLGDWEGAPTSAEVDRAHALVDPVQR